jgi:hypothetical protein
MSLEAIKNAVTSKTARQVFLAQKHSPKILFVAGTVGVIGATVLACRATLKISDALDAHEKAKYELDRDKTTVDIDTNTMLLTEKEGQQLERRLQIKTALAITNPYLPAIGLGIVSIAALTGSHVILSKRNSTVMAAYAGLDRAYRQYRKNVIEKYGEEDDRKLAANVRTVHVEEKLADGKTKITPKDEISKTDGHNGSPYATLFDETSRRFTKEPGMNAMLLSTQQSYANDKLRANGHIFLNEVLDSLGLARAPQGQIVGWLYRPNDADYTGDGYVDFGVFEGDQERAEAFIDGVEKSVWLDFNVDGPIWDKI